MTRQDTSYDLGIDSACSDFLTEGKIDTTKITLKITLLGFPVIPGRHKARNPRLAIDEAAFWQGYKAEMEARI